MSVLGGVVKVAVAIVAAAAGGKLGKVGLGDIKNKLSSNKK